VAVAQPARSLKEPRQSVGGGGIQLSGDAVVVPRHTPAGQKLTESDTGSDSKQASIYTVRPGDTLSNIADLFDVSVDTIVWANDISGETIAPGDTLVILPMSGIRHEVKEGETISEIADRFGVTTEKIREYNELDDTQLSVGAILDIPGGEKPERNQPTESKTANTTVQSQSVTPNHSAQSGYYTHPLPNGVRTQGRHGYNAVDFGASVGTPVVAAASGNVEKSVPSGWNGGYGKFLVIRHDNGTKTLYSHLSSVLVNRGQRVVEGETIGYVGNTGRSTGPHLHFEVRGARNPF
jgi:murein DD-endopeptidase MepM/ murein hydrolase activator NlpD